MKRHRFSHIRRLDRGNSSLMRVVLFSSMVMGMMAGVWGCTGLPRPEADPATQRTIERLTKQNTGLKGFKAIGRIAFAEGGQPIQSYRFAAAGRLPEKLRIDLLAPFGGSAASVASDGRHLFVVRHPSRQFKRWSLGRGSLQRFVGLPIRIKDLLTLMTGKIPLYEGYVAHTAMSPNGDDAIVLQIADRGGRLRQSVTMDERGRPVEAVWYDAQGRQTMALEMDGEIVVDGHVLPRQINLGATAGGCLTISFDRYMANPQTPDELFTLTPIGS